MNLVPTLPPHFFKILSPVTSFKTMQCQPRRPQSESVHFLSDYSDLKQDQKRMEHFTSLYGVLIDFIGESNMPNSAELMGIYGRVSMVRIKLVFSKLEMQSSTSVILAELIPDRLNNWLTTVHLFEENYMLCRTDNYRNWIFLHFFICVVVTCPIVCILGSHLFLVNTMSYYILFSTSH
jgi:hypothetical protein